MRLQWKSLKKGFYWLKEQEVPSVEEIQEATEPKLIIAEDLGEMLEL